MIIVDESHYLKNGDAQRTKSLLPILKVRIANLFQLKMKFKLRFSYNLGAGVTTDRWHEALDWGH